MIEPAADAPIRVLIVDDHPMLREGLAAVLQSQGDIQVVGEADDGAKAIAAFRSLLPDVTLMDLQMPNMSGVAAISAIRRDYPKARIIVLTTYGGDVQALRALKAGAAGYLLKSAVRKELLDAIHAVHAGRRYLPPDIATEIAVHAIDEALTGREIDILKLIAVGEANKQIARQLGVSEETVKSHLKSIFLKLDVADRTHAVTIAAKRGIIDIS